MTTRAWLVTSLALVVATAGVATAQMKGAAAPSAPSAAPSARMAPAVPTDYVIGPEDVLNISVWKNEALSRTLPVRPDGKISLPLLHDVQAAGLTAMQLREKLTSALSEFIPNPDVSVIVSEVRSFRVSVMGEVHKPGILYFKSEATILDAIAMAGGFRDFASPSKIVVFRKDGNGKTQKLQFNYNRAVKSDGDNLVLRTGDVIVVP
ncbi:MAG: polysaccharide biosynthesis/export family protein [Candidatus Rokubacteria bacterium]|nr:polysaccharide biosynthesis/export family protein [Candidatus Rokubacteria bacterium]